MRLYIIILMMYLGQNIGSSQNLKERRKLNPLSKQADTVSVKIKYDKSKQIKYLSQSYLEYNKKESFIIVEKYRKNKFWTLFRFKEMIRKEKKNSSIVSEVADGKQYQFNEKGQVIYIDNYTNGIADEISIEYQYYSNGELKFIAEGRNNEFWNVIEYRYPDGRKYDFGDFKNGKGTIVHLNESGEPCLECITIKKQTTLKKLCKDNKTKNKAVD